MKYELFTTRRVGEVLRVIREFDALSDTEAWEIAQRIFNELPSQNIAVIYQVREQSTRRIIEPDCE